MPKSLVPPKSLRQTLAIPRTIFEKNGGNPMFRVTLAQELSCKADARVFRDLITASAGYGLTKGSYAAERIELLPRGERILKGEVDAIYETLFSVDILKRFHESFKGGSGSLPSEKAAKDFLKAECQVPDLQLDPTYKAIIADARDWWLIQNLAGGEKLVPLDLAKQEALKNSITQVGSTPVINSSEEASGSAVGGKPEKGSVAVAPVLHLNIQIHIAADTPEDKIEIIFKNMRKYLLDE